MIATVLIVLLVAAVATAQRTRRAN